MTQTAFMTTPMLTQTAIYRQRCGRRRRRLLRCAWKHDLDLNEDTGDIAAATATEGSVSDALDDFIDRDSDNDGQLGRRRQQ